MLLNKVVADNSKNLTPYSKAFDRPRMRCGDYLCPGCQKAIVFYRHVLCHDCEASAKREAAEAQMRSDQ